MHAKGAAGLPAIEVETMEIAGLRTARHVVRSSVLPCIALQGRLFTTTVVGQIAGQVQMLEAATTRHVLAVAIGDAGMRQKDAEVEKMAIAMGPLATLISVPTRIGLRAIAMLYVCEIGQGSSP